MKAFSGCISVVAVLVCSVVPAAGQTENAEPAEPEVLGAPADWSFDESSESLVSIPEGARLRLEPSLEATVLRSLPAARLALLESTAGWMRVRYGDLEGWVHVDSLALATVPVETLREVSPTKVIETGYLEQARALIARGEREERWGPFAVYTDVLDRQLLAELADVAVQLAQVYVERYGHAQHGVLRGASLVIYADEQMLHRFARRLDEKIIAETGGLTLPDLAVIFVGRRSRRAVTASLVHELTHLFNGQSLATDLPLWLDEGLAEDLALSRLSDGRLEPSPLTLRNLRLGRYLDSAVKELLVLNARGAALPLEDLLTMDRMTFQSGEASQHYMMAALWVRYLLSGPEPALAQAFRSFLEAVAAGGDASVESLAAHLLEPPLARAWIGHQLGFYSWLVDQSRHLR